mmetsp:Transcript_30948/g.93600  ORF Transcript_30948/g.93600 Transcript_30948/m.93600 type:complete len:236 (+) Transcript_30948:932-1639(+)
MVSKTAVRSGSVTSPSKRGSARARCFPRTIAAGGMPRKLRPKGTPCSMYFVNVETKLLGKKLSRQVVVESKTSLAARRTPILIARSSAVYFNLWLATTTLQPTLFTNSSIKSMRSSPTAACSNVPPPSQSGSLTDANSGQDRKLWRNVHDGCSPRSTAEISRAWSVESDTHAFEPEAVAIKDPSWLNETACTQPPCTTWNTTVPDAVSMSSSLLLLPTATTDPSWLNATAVTPDT